MTNKEAKEIIESECYVFNPLNLDRTTKINTALDVAIKALEQEPEIKVLERDEVLRKLGTTVDIYQVIAWVELVNDLEYLGLKICEVENNDD